MTPRAERAKAVFNRSVTEALGYVKLAQKTQAQGGDTTSLRDAALEALRRFSGDDDLVDALYEADMLDVAPPGPAPG